MSRPALRTLGEVVSISKGKRHAIVDASTANAKRLIGIDDLRNDEVIRYTNDTNGIEVVAEDILIAWDGANAGTIGFGKAGLIGSTIARLRTKEKGMFHTPFLGPFLQSKFAYLRKTATGATIPHINRKALEEIVLPDIGLDEQKRVAYLLCKLERLMGCRKHQMLQLDELLKSIFLEMFGDPVRNEKGWEKKPFDELLDNIDSGKSPKCEARKVKNNEWGVLKLGAVTSCIYKENENKALPAKIIPNARDEVKAGDLLFSRKNTYELVAACAYIFKTRPRLLLPDLIFRFVLKEGSGINPIFLWKLLISSSQRKTIQALAGGAAGSMPNISKANLKRVLLPVPPVNIQNQFSAIVEKVEGISSCYQESLIDLERLYGALCQTVFKGELDLSGVPLPTADPYISEKEENDVKKSDSTEPLLELPGEMEISMLQTAEAKTSLLAQWLNAWLDQIGDEPFSSQTFMDGVRHRLGELTEDDMQDWGAAEYDQIKGLVFEALGEGRLSQSYDDANNRVQLTPSIGKSG